MEILANEEYKRFVEGVAGYGMPVNFLRTVGGNYYLLFNDSVNQVNRRLDILWLRRDNIKTLPSTISPEPPFGESTVISTIYHEATHAFFDIMNDRPVVKDLVGRASGYYLGAPFKNAPNLKLEKPEIVVQEGAAMYVEQRAATWWKTFEALTLLRQDALTNAAVMTNFHTKLIPIRQDYDRELAQLSFGYEPRSISGSKGIQQLYVNKPIFPELKRYLDQVLLESKIPDQFDQVLYFTSLATPP
jgi:hypothetical protein